MRIPLAGGEPLQLAESDGARALALDRATVWLVSHGRLSAFDLAGERRLTTLLPVVESTRSLLVGRPADGSLWLAEGPTLSPTAGPPAGYRRRRMRRNAGGRRRGR